MLKFVPLKYPKKNKVFTLLLIAVLALSSCSKDENGNLSPKDFELSLGEVSATTAEINWTTAIDPEGRVVSYALYLNNSSIVEGLSTNSYNLTGLESKTNYEVKLIATDPEGNRNEKKLNFNTTDKAKVDANLNITLDYAKYTNAKISWSYTSSNSGEIKYDLYFMDELRESDLTYKKYEFFVLENDTEYQGKLVAKQDGKVLGEKAFTFKTLYNAPPTPFKITLLDKTFFSFQIDIAESTDPDNEGSLKYQLFVDDVNATEEKFGSTVTIGAGSTRHDDLQGNTTYKVQVRATDRKGGKTFSNTLEITTDPTPPATFTVIEVVPGPTSLFTLPEIYSKVGYNVNSFYLDGEKFTLDGVYSTKNEDGSRTFHFDKEDIPETNKTYNLEFEVGWHSTWNSNTGQTYYSKSDNQGLQLRVNEYSPTSADVQTVYLYGPNHATAPLQFIVKFHDNKISDYEDYDIYMVKIGGIEVKNYFVNQIGAANEVSLTGSVTLEEYNTIKENPNNSRVVTIDESGYHALTEYSIAFEE
ncbi:fibronectin type III domain-containing protein [Zobellia uliginosa]|uniref:fibronectin type III domain-containing protein n=1 Tax=Zobellia uliginosa TaxID=143224 RepID=UPI0026E35A24|nr:fibronectin type III domain-containing protein [Zobellia uliginosa]MDO6516064.1 fibronectin type III domain-containing protein [Zobellia uliginosa]